MKLHIPSANNIEFICTELMKDNSINKALYILKKFSADTYEHSLKVAMYSIYLGNALSLNRTELFDLVKGALVHDIGKIYFSYELLNFQGKYNSEQRKLIMKHPEFGLDFFKERNLYISKNVSDIIVQHHELCDGTGYPNGLNEESISRFARIITICDIFEAFTAERVYHPKRTYKEGIEHLLYLWFKGKIDDEIARLFINILLGA